MANDSHSHDTSLLSSSKRAALNDDKDDESNSDAFSIDAKLSIEPFECNNHNNVSLTV
jgi:hypothetical protein